MNPSQPNGGTALTTQPSTSFLSSTNSSLSFISQITELLREINQLLQNPAFQQAVGSRLGLQLPSTSAPTPTNPQPLQQPTSNLLTSFSPSQIMKMLDSPQGKEMIKTIIDILTSIFGDIKLSELREKLLGEPKKEIKGDGKDASKPAE